MYVLVTGGAGYIGSHTCLELLKNGYQVAVVDNLINSSEESLKRVSQITGKEIKFYNADITDKKSLSKIFDEIQVDSVIHFAALKAVGESSQKPLEYYQNNISGTLTLLEVMREHKVNNLIFSSSATVYGSPKTVPIKEDFDLSATNPYGRTKLYVEQMLKDISIAYKDLNIVLLRYFNPIGAHKSGLIGENPKGIPNNLMPYITQVAVGKLPYLNVFGDDYDTKDGTGVRDYIHVVDLAIGHIKALEGTKNKKGISIYNLGTGHGYSVLELLKAFEEASGIEIPYKIVDRRKGDIATCYADPTKAKEDLGFETQYNLYDMCKDSIMWQKKNPNGYED